MDSPPPPNAGIDTDTHRSSVHRPMRSSLSDSNSNSSLFSNPEASQRPSTGESDEQSFGPVHIFASATPAAWNRRDGLRIRVPSTPSLDTSLSLERTQVAGDEPVRAPRTTTMPHSPLSRATSEFVVDPNTAVILQEFRAQQSTMALLSADLTTKSLLDASRSKPPIPPGTAKRPSDAATRKRATSFGLFRRSGPRATNASFGARPPAATERRRRDSTRDDDPLSPDAEPAVSPSEPTEATEVAALDSVKADDAPPASAAPEAPGNSSSTSNEDGGVNSGDKGDSEDVAMSALGGMEKVLKEASDVHGLRLTWLLYAMICIVIALFIMIFIQITYMTNGTLKRTGREAVQTKISSLANNAEMLVSELRFFYELAFSMALAPTNSTAAQIHDLCSRIFGAPIAVNLYNGTGGFMKRIDCPGEEEIPVYGSVPTVAIVSPYGPRIVFYSEDIITAYRSVALTDDPTMLSTISVFLKRQTIGQFMLSNAVAEYSSATMQDVYTSVVLPLSARAINAGSLEIALRTLDATTPNYTTGQDSVVTQTLRGEFVQLCEDTHEYRWDKVLRPLTLDLGDNFSSSSTGESDVESVSSAIPQPYMESHSTWGLLSKTVQCGVVCTHPNATTCTQDNPTNIYMMARYSVRANGWSSVTTVASVSIAAVIIFSMLLVIAYFSISTPVNFLRYQIMRIVGVERTRTRLQRGVDRVTHRIWIGDMTALIRSVHVLGICFQVNKKYVPLHVLRAIAEELSRQRLNVFETYEVDDHDSDDFDSDPSDQPPGQLLLAGNDNSTVVINASPIRPELVEMEERQTDVPAQRVNAGDAIDVTRDDVNTSRSYDLLTFSPVHGVGAGRESESTTAVPFISTDHLLGDRSGIFGESMMAGGTDLGASGAFSATLMRSMAMPQGRHMLMTINRDDGATILTVRIGGIDSAYLFNYSVTARNHQVIMAFLLHCIRHHRGSIFYRTGDCLGVVWNAFDSCANHAAKAAACASDMSAAFAEHRLKGLQVGIVLHQGNFVFGNVDDSKEAFVTAFGEAPQQAISLADYAASQSTLNVVVTEPVKQSLTSLYEFAIVDVIRVVGNSNHLILFDLCGRRTSPSAALTPSAFALGYTKAFSLFRDNRFDEAVGALQHMEPVTNVSEQRLVYRLTQLSMHFARHPRTITRPYCRPYPHWVNYEMMALADATAIGAQSRNARRSLHDLDSPVKELSTLSPPPAPPYAFPFPSLDEVGAKIEEVDDAMVFKRDLHDTVRRLGTPHYSLSTTSCVTVPASVKSHAEPKLTPMSPISPMPQVQTLRLQATEATQPCPLPLGGNFDGDAKESCSPLTPRNASFGTCGPASSAATSTFNSHDPVGSTPPLNSAMTNVNADDSVATPLGNSFAMATPPMLAGLAPATAVDKSPGSSSTTRPDEVEARRATSLATALSGSVWRGDASRNRSGDFVREDTDNMFALQQSLIQSVSFTLDGTLNPASDPAASATQAIEDTPAEILAKNGNVYLRSGRLLGRGSFGSVYMGVDVNSGKLVAIKYLPLRSEESEVAGIEAEVFTMQRVKDSHVVEFISYAFQNENIVLIMECMMAGSLQNMITAFHTLPNTTARLFIRDVLRGLNKLHTMGVVHRDVKPQNVLLTLTGSCKISDFGASASIQELARKDSEGRVFGTPVYLAPEAAQGKPVKKSDIWSCGIMFLQLLTGKLPYPDDKLCLDAALLVYQIGSYIARPVIPPNLDEMDALFVRECLKAAPTERPTAAQLLQLPLFAL